MDLILVSCATTKGDDPAPARELYVSPLFRKSRAYAERTGRPWFILSAEYGLLTPDQVIAPYERYLPATPPSYRSAWGRWVAERLDLLAGPLAGRVVEIHAGSAYVDAVAGHLTAKGAEIVDRLHGLSQGDRLAWYGNEQAGQPPEPVADRLVAELLDGDAAVRPAEFLATAAAGLRVPGLYSWWVDAPGADDLSRGLDETVAPGLVYAGLAGATRWPSGVRSASTLWDRIATMHLGGNHNFSTFRLTLGAVLAAATGADRIDEAALTVWMKERLRVRTVRYDDRDTLGRIEKLVLGRIDPPLNLQDVPRTPLRARLTELRRQFK
jgi:hypothetical protein